MQSHLSELQRQQKKSLSSLEGYSVPNTRQFNAKECFLDIKFDQVNQEIHNSSSEQMLTPRGTARDQPDNQLLNAKKQLRSSSHEAPQKIIEFYSPVYLASIVLKNGVNANE
jgi:hypothetical protein